MKLSKPLYLFPLVFLLFFTTGIVGGVHASYNDRKKHAINGFRATKLFVFGDSYVDTGNIGRSVGSSWRQPYGISFPGKPSGRFSDGRVLTDYIARFLGVKSPIPYTIMKYAKQRLQYGVNFAYGGTGVFQTIVRAPNMTIQIDFLQKLISDSVYTKGDMQSSLFLVSAAGNDYGNYIATGGTFEDLPRFIKSLVDQLAANLKRLHDMGAKKVSVVNLEPLGCLPSSTVFNSYKKCNETRNMAVGLHNSLLQEAVERLNYETNGGVASGGSAPFFILDIHNAFTDVIEQKGVWLESKKFETPLTPCCKGISEGYLCSNKDEKGVKMYTICSDPNAAFFWDLVHPTQAGWRAIYTSLKPTIQQMFV